MAAVRTGSYAAVIPTQVWENNPDLECEVVDDVGLSDLDRPIALTWSSRNLESIGPGLIAFRDGLQAALVEEAERRGMDEREK